MIVELAAGSARDLMEGMWGSMREAVCGLAEHLFAATGDKMAT